MRVTVLSHNLSSNAAMRAHRLALVAQTFAEDVRLIGPASRKGTWPALPDEPWIVRVAKRRLPEFASSFLELVDLADGDVLIAAKPQLASVKALASTSLRLHAPRRAVHPDARMPAVHQGRGDRVVQLDVAHHEVAREHRADLPGRVLEHGEPVAAVGYKTAVLVAPHGASLPRG